MHPNDSDLVRSAQNGDPAAFSELVTRYESKVYHLALRMLRDEQDAEDVLQETFVSVYRHLSDFRGDSEFSTWLYRITTNVCLSHRSRGRRHSHTSLDQNVNDDDGQPHALKDTLAGDTSADQQAHDAEISMRVEQALKTLSPRQRMVFTLKHYEGYKLREIAEMMKCREGTVKKYLFEAMARLKKQLKDFAV